MMTLFKNMMLQSRQAGLVIAIVITVVLSWSAVWLVIADKALDKFEVWASEQQKGGYKISWQELDASGYPFSLIIEVVNPVVEARGSWRWSTQHLILQTSLWGYEKIDVRPATQHRIFLSYGSSLHTYNLSAKSIHGSVVLKQGRWDSFGIQTTGLLLSEGDQMVVGLDSGQIKIESSGPSRPEFFPMTGALEARMQGIEAPALPEYPFGQEISRLSLRAELFGEAPNRIDENALAIWRDQGGVLEVRYLDFVYGALELETSGTMALDGELQPVGALTAKVLGYSETIDAMRAGGVISGADALGAKVVLGALARTDKNTGRSQLNLALTLQQRTLNAGPIALAKIPPVVWP